MKIFLLTQQSQNGMVELTGDDYHYLCHVKRLKSGDSLRLKDTENHLWIGVIREISHESCSIELMEDLGTEDLLSRKLYLIQCLPKGKKADLIFRQAGEAGVFRIQPVTSDHSMIKLGNEKERIQKTERWNRVVREALQQSGSSVRTEVLMPGSFSSIEEYKDKTVFFLHQEQRSSLDIKRILTESTGDIALVIGPEGGFSEKEVIKMEEWGYNPVFLGQNVLRTETAALYAVAMMQTMLGVVNG